MPCVLSTCAGKNINKQMCAPYLSPKSIEKMNTVRHEMQHKHSLISILTQKHRETKSKLFMAVLSTLKLDGIAGGNLCTKTITSMLGNTENENAETVC